MSDKDMISKAFASLKAPDDTLERIHEKMDNEKKERNFFHHKKMVLVLAAVLVLAIGTTGVYAVKAFRLNKTLAPSVSDSGRGFVISAPFAEINSYTQTQHDGIDFAAELGTPVLAAASGEVITAESDIQKGNYIVISHEDSYTTLYAHLDEIYVSAGDTVNVGTEIGTVGNTGFSTGPHLHLELRKDGEPVNPADYWE